jgi:hypothetical protein
MFFVLYRKRDHEVWVKVCSYRKGGATYLGRVCVKYPYEYNTWLNSRRLHFKSQRYVLDQSPILGQLFTALTMDGALLNVSLNAPWDYPVLGFRATFHGVYVRRHGI